MLIAPNLPTQVSLRYMKWSSNWSAIHESQGESAVKPRERTNLETITSPPLGMIAVFCTYVLDSYRKRLIVSYGYVCSDVAIVF